LGEEKLDYKKVCQLPFGSYAQVHDDLDITNTMESRTTRAINLGPTGNIQGTHRFLSLKTGELIVRCKWMELPIPSDVISHSEELAGDSRYVMESLKDREIEYDHGDLIEANVENKSTEDTEDEDIIEKNVDGIQRQADAGNILGEGVNVDEVENEEQEREKPIHGYNLRGNRERDYSHRFA
jgi:hypothetical protein